MSQVYNHGEDKRQRGPQQCTNAKMSARQCTKNKMIEEAKSCVLLGEWERKNEGRSKDNRAERLYRLVVP